MAYEPFPASGDAPHRAADLRQYKQVSGPGLAAAILIGLSVVATAISAWTSWHALGVIEDYVNDVAGVTRADLDDADRLVSGFSWTSLIALLATAVVFLVWLWRARRNAELLSSYPHRRTRGWTVAAWLVPVLNCWYPYQVVSDIHWASAPKPADGPRHDSTGRAQLAVWWAFWLGGTVLDRIAGYIWRGDLTVDSLRAAAILESIGAVCYVGAAMLIIVIMRRISGWQINAVR